MGFKTIIFRNLFQRVFKAILVNYPTGASSFQTVMLWVSDLGFTHQMRLVLSFSGSGVILHEPQS